jgi:hypothetical protein
MTPVRFADATRYATKLFGFLLAVTVVATGALALGWWIVAPEIGPALGAGTADKAPLVGGAALIVLGGVVFAVGWLTAAYKLLADGVHAGRSAAAGTAASGTGALAASEATGEATGVETDPEGAADRDEDRPTTMEALGAAGEAQKRARDAEATDSPGDDETASVGNSRPTSGVGEAAEPAESGSGSGSGGWGSPGRGSTNESETSARGPDGAAPDRETDPQPVDRETNPEPPRSPPDDDQQRPEPSAEEIAFGNADEVTGGEDGVGTDERETGADTDRSRDTEPGRGDVSGSAGEGAGTGADRSPVDEPPIDEDAAPGSDATGGTAKDAVGDPDAGEEPRGGLEPDSDVESGSTVEPETDADPLADADE